MKYTLLLVAICCLPGIIQSQELTKIFIVRHAERVQGDDLSAAGLTRAEELKRILYLSGVRHIFSTNTIRTTKTATPLSLLLGIPVKNYTTAPELIKEIKNGVQGETTLVVGHSNTVGALISECGCTPPADIVPNMADTQYDNLFLVMLRKSTVNNQVNWFCELTRMKYGAVTN